MIATITGMFIKQDYKEREIDGKKVKEPFVVIYSDDQAVNVPNLKLDGDIKPGTMIDIPCVIKLLEWDGRKYLSIKPLEG